MPPRIPKPCTKPGCSATTTTGGRCETHAIQQRKESDSKRGTSSERGYNSRWRQSRLLFLADHPLCEECALTGRVEPATVVDHVKPHRGDMALFWDKNNWRSLCATCHNRKTAREDGGFGR